LRRERKSHGRICAETQIEATRKYVQCQGARFVSTSITSLGDCQVNHVPGHSSVPPEVTCVRCVRKGTGECQGSSRGCCACVGAHGGLCTVCINLYRVVHVLARMVGMRCAGGGYRMCTLGFGDEASVEGDGGDEVEGKQRDDLCIQCSSAHAVQCRQCSTCSAAPSQCT
jgi:hypothetical protein